jgi:hypothetical protein
MKALSKKNRSHLVSAILAGCWRDSDFPLLEISEIELDEVTPLLYGSGAAGLGWWRLRETDLNQTASAEVLHQAYRLQVLQSGIHEEKIIKVFKLLREASIEPILIKGWAAAALYPSPGLRPYGDIDLFVRPQQYETARELLAGPSVKDCWVDLHKHLSELDDRSIQELFDRARRLPLKQESVTILSAEDHLALLAVHMLKHGAWRPLWLCDIGGAIESLPTGFDWELCLGRDRTRSSWIRVALSLAHRLLGARLDAVPEKALARQLPEWLLESVLQQWEQPFASNQPPMSHPVPMSTVWRRPRMLLDALRQRWPNPILATVSVNGRFNNLPRLPYQIGNCLMRGAHFFGALPPES